MNHQSVIVLFQSLNEIIFIIANIAALILSSIIVN